MLPRWEEMPTRRQISGERVSFRFAFSFQRGILRKLIGSALSYFRAGDGVLRRL